VAENVAAALGWNLLDHELLKKIAKRPTSPRRWQLATTSTWTPGLTGWSKPCGAADSNAVRGINVGVMDCEGMLEFTRHAMHEAADLGNCVIMGRGGNAYSASAPMHSNLPYMRRSSIAPVACKKPSVTTWRTQELWPTGWTRKRVGYIALLRRKLV